MAITEAQVRAHLEPEEPNYAAAAAALGPDALPVLEALISGSDPLLASKAAYLTSLIPGERSARALEEAARSGHPTVRVAAAAGLQKRPDVSDETTATLMDDDDQGVRKVAAKGVRKRAAAPREPAERGAGPREPDQRLPAATPSAGQVTEDEHGGGFSPRMGPTDEPAAGEGGGDVGAGRTRSASQQDDERESGGGGDLTGAADVRGSRSDDGPDGGGSGGGSARSTGESNYGGGQV